MTAHVCRAEGSGGCCNIYFIERCAWIVLIIALYLLMVFPVGHGLDR